MLPFQISSRAIAGHRICRENLEDLSVPPETRPKREGRNTGVQSFLSLTRGWISRIQPARSKFQRLVRLVAYTQTAISSAPDLPRVPDSPCLPHGPLAPGVPNKQQYTYGAQYIMDYYIAGA